MHLRFALLLEDKTASDMSPAITEAAAKYNKTIALTEVITTNERFALRIGVAARSFVRNMIKAPGLGKTVFKQWLLVIFLLK